MSYNKTLQGNNLELQVILDIVKSLPHAGNDAPETGGGVELPDLNNPAGPAQMFAGYDAIDETGAVVEGSFTIAAELSEQEALIDQIRTALQRKGCNAVGFATLGNMKLA